uniref:sequestosome-1-like n=1 Tax=Myxine glutinosa TaxID=7769 RepID=UPI00358FF26D
MESNRGRDIPVKAFLGLCQDGSSPKEVRRFTVSALALYSELTAGIATAFPTLGSRFILHYRDDEGDLVTFSSDVEWQEVVQSRPERLMRIFIKVDKKEMRQEGAAEQAAGNSSRSTRSSGEQQEQPAGPGSSAGQQQRRKNRWGGCTWGDGSSWSHPGVVCDGCEGPVVGTRYKCTVCSSYDLCSKCKERGLHAEHIMCEVPFPAHHWGFCGPRGHHMRWNSAWAGGFPPGGPHGPLGPHGPFGPHGPYGSHRPQGPHGPRGRGPQAPHAPPFFQFYAAPCDPHFFSGSATEEGGTANHCDPNEEFLHTVGENVAAMLDPLGINVTVDVDHNGVHSRCSSTGQGTKTWTGPCEEKPGTDSHPDNEPKQDKKADSKEQTADVQMTSSDEEWTHVVTDAKDGSTDGEPQPSTVADPEEAGGQEPKPLNEKAKVTVPNEDADKRLAEALSQMLSMGFGDENGELSRLLLSRNCNVSSAIDALATVHSSTGIRSEQGQIP